MSKILIVIPARYASTRLPGKPLIKIGGREMIVRVSDIAKYLCRNNQECDYIVATDDEQIVNFCKSHDIHVTMSSPNCKSGTERSIDVVERMANKPDFIINLQGDNPLCPPWVIQDLINEWIRCKEKAVYTPFVNLSWDALLSLQESKKVTPYSGTTVIMDKEKFALAFSKKIIPEIRNLEKAKNKYEKSPVNKHVGLYAYTYDVLLGYKAMELSVLEDSCIEGLEQMRFLYNRIPVKMVEVDYRGRDIPSGVDSPEDVLRVEDNIKTFGEYSYE